MSQTRRTFLATLGGAAAGLVAGRGALAAMPSPWRATKLSRIGIQLYTVRKPAAADLAGTLARLAAIGYEEVELAGFYGHSAADVRALLDRNGLAAPSTHLDARQLEGDAAAKTFADAKVVGNQWLTVPSPPGRPAMADDWAKIAKRFNEIAARAKGEGFRFAYHNHNAELRRLGDTGTTPYEILLKETDPALVSFEMDIYWVVNGGGDPIDLIARHPARFRMLHVKDSKGPPAHQMVDVGAGVIDFRPIFARATSAEHYFVEHDQPADPLASAAASFAYLSHLEY